MPRWQLPPNVSDALPVEARRIEDLRRTLLDHSRGYGYELISPPLIENLEALLTGSGSRMALRTFKTVDQLTGLTLGVRADMTPQAARIDSHMLDRDGVTRLCYAGSVLHTLPFALRATREPVQLGAELFGHQGLEADLEILELMLESLRLAGMRELRLDLTHSALVPALLDIARATGDWPQAEFDTDALYALLVQKDASGLVDLLDGCPGVVRDALLALTTLYGPVGPADTRVLDDARRRLPASPAIDAALNDLGELVGSQLWRRLGGVELSVDLADLQGYHYYSGVSFAVFGAGANGHAMHAEALARGGRYDGIGAAFGRARPAVGFSLELRTLVALAGQSTGPVRPKAIRAPWVDDAALRIAIAALRSDGEIVVQALPGHEPEPQEFECAHELVERDGQWVVIELVERE
ncbi:MAG: ATP phosphoribosyltransferase regulatory subunit [Burkholderiaceae bacterium]